MATPGARRADESPRRPLVTVVQVAGPAVGAAGRPRSRPAPRRSRPGAAVRLPTLMSSRITRCSTSVSTGRCRSCSSPAGCRSSSATSPVEGPTAVPHHVTVELGASRLMVSVRPPEPGAGATVGRRLIPGGVRCCAVLERAPPRRSNRSSRCSRRSRRRSAVGGATGAVIGLVGSGRDRRCPAPTAVRVARRGRRDRFAGAAGTGCGVRGALAAVAPPSRRGGVRAIRHPAGRECGPPRATARLPRRSRRFAAPRRSGETCSVVPATCPRRRLSCHRRLGLRAVADPPRRSTRNAPRRPRPVVEAASLLRDVPTEIDLASESGTAIAIVGDYVSAVARSLVVQLAVQCGPADWRLVVVTDDLARHEWAEWLPHTTSGPRLNVRGRARRHTGADRGTRSARRRRPSCRGPHRHADGVGDPHRARCVGSSPRSGPSRRSPTIDHDEAVPAFCRSVLEVGMRARARWSLTGDGALGADRLHVTGLAVDTACSIAWCLAGLSDPEDLSIVISSRRAAERRDQLPHRIRRGAEQPAARRLYHPPAHAPDGHAGRERHGDFFGFMFPRNPEPHMQRYLPPRGGQPLVSPGADGLALRRGGRALPTLQRQRTSFKLEQDQETRARL